MYLYELLDKYKDCEYVILKSAFSRVPGGIVEEEFSVDNLPSNIYMLYVSKHVYNRDTHKLWNLV